MQYGLMALIDTENPDRFVRAVRSDGGFDYGQQQNARRWSTVTEIVGTLRDTKKKSPQVPVTIVAFETVEEVKSVG